MTTHREENSKSGGDSKDKTRTRRAHAKSHFGCLQCKEKRVKCDESRPKCNRCAKRGSECTYDLFIHHVQGPSGRKASSPRPKSPNSNGGTSIVSRKDSLQKTRLPTESTIIFANKPSPSLSNASSSFSYDMGSTTWQLPTVNSTISKLSPEDYQLYDHFVTSVSTTFRYQIYAGWGAWDTSIPENAQTHPYLLSGMLATSAIHLALTQPEKREEYIQTAMRHHYTALREYRPVVSAGLKASEYESALGFTALLIIGAFGLQSALFKNSMETLEIQHADPIVEIRNIIVLFRGMSHIHQVGYFGKSELSLDAQLQTNAEVSDAFLPAAPGEHSLDILVQDFLQHDFQRAHIDMMESSDFDFTVPDQFGIDPGQPSYASLGISDRPMKCPTDVYMFLIDRLRRSLRRAVQDPHESSQSFMWAAVTPRAFSAALSVHRPLALVLIAHWAVLLHNARHHWWADDWGVRLVATVARALGSEWRKYILWPLQEVGLDEDELVHANFSMDL